MHPKLWRFLISVSLRLFLEVTTPAGTHFAVLWLVAIFIAFAIPAPQPGRPGGIAAVTRKPDPKA